MLFRSYHIINDSRVSVFLMDGEQSYRDSETTTVSDIERYADELGASFECIDLGDAQFRCAGSKEYVDWVERFLGLSDVDGDAPWRRKTAVGHGFHFEVIDCPFDLDHKLRDLAAKGQVCRLVSSYAVPWETKKRARPHDRTQGRLDFELSVPDGTGGKTTWHRPWNFAPGEDYTMFIQGTTRSKIAEDPVAEVGCPYVVRGFDFDYLGVLWLEDLVWRKDRWVYQLPHIHETALKVTIADAKKGINHGRERLLERIQRGYRILLTRALKGIFLYVHDKETRDHLRASLSKC